MTRPKMIQLYDFKLLLKYLESVENEAYEGFYKYIETDLETARKFKAIVEKFWNLRMRIAQELKLRFKLVTK